MEGLSIAWAVMEHLHNVIGMMLLIHCSTLLLWLTDCRTLLATHYHELESLARSLPGVACYKLVAERSEDDLIFTYKIEVLICVSLKLYCRANWLVFPLFFAIDFWLHE